MKKPKKIAIIGSYPPPYGGISVHIKRVLEYLKKDEYVLYNTAPNAYAESVSFYGKIKVFILFSFLFKKFRLIHHHSPDKTVRLLLCFLGYFKSEIYMHIHGASIEDNFKDKSISPFLLKKILRNVNIIADNSRIINIVKPYNPKKIYQIDAFLPPVYKKNIYIDFTNQVSPPKIKILIGMVGWFNEYRNTDLYGYDIALEALNILRNKHAIDIGILASVNGINSEILYKQFIEKRSKLNLDDYFFLLTNDFEEIWPLYLISDVFIRPTISDGSSVALLEAMWFETKTIASDAVPRPDSVLLFKNRNVSDLAYKILSLVDKGFPSQEERLQKVINKKFESKLIKDIYKIER